MRWNFIGADIPYTILGADFLTQYQAIIEFSSKSISFAKLNKTLNCVRPEDAVFFNQRSHSIFLAPSRSQQCNRQREPFSIPLTNRFDILQCGDEVAADSTNPTISAIQVRPSKQRLITKRYIGTKLVQIITHPSNHNTPDIRTKQSKPSSVSSGTVSTHPHNHNKPAIKTKQPKPLSISSEVETSVNHSKSVKPPTEREPVASVGAFNECPTLPMPSTSNENISPNPTRESEPAASVGAVNEDAGSHPHLTPNETDPLKPPTKLEPTATIGAVNEETTSSGNVLTEIQASPLATKEFYELCIV